MYPYVFDFKDYFTIAGALFTLLLIAFFLIWFFFDLKTKFNLKEGQKANAQIPGDDGGDDGATWLDRNLLIMMLVGTTLVYGLYFVLYYACRVFHAPWIAALYWVLCGLFLLILLSYICISEWHHEEKTYGDVSFYQKITGRSLTQKFKEIRERNGGKGVSS
jgi:Ca2+/Na+ antiporter